MKYFRLCCPRRRVGWDAKSSGQLHGVLAKSWHPGCGFLGRGLEKQDGRPVPFQLWHEGINEARKTPQSRTTMLFLIMQENKHHTTSRACGVCACRVGLSGWLLYFWQHLPQRCQRALKSALFKKRLFSSPWKSDLWSTGHWFRDFRGHSLEVTGFCSRMCLCMLACHHIHICVVIIMIRGIISIKFLQ